MVNSLLNRKVLGYDDVLPYPAGDSQEALVDARTYDQTIVARYNKKDMLPYTGETIYVRRELASRLAFANQQLAKSGYTLKIVYGYRHPEVQAGYFSDRRHALAEEFPELSESRLDKLTHNYVAHPNIAGHPAGAAVDVTIVTTKNDEVDMGTAIADYTDPVKICTDASSITRSQAANRAVLHDAMVGAGFAPFYGEWWHFSYGDREWAAFYEKSALYGPVDFRLEQ